MLAFFRLNCCFSIVLEWCGLETYYVFFFVFLLNCYHGSSSRFWFCWMFCVIFDKHQCCNVFTAMNYWQHSIMETNKLTCCLRLINNLTYLKYHVLPRQCIMQHFSVFSFKSIKLWTFIKTRMKRLAFLVFANVHIYSSFNIYLLIFLSHTCLYLLLFVLCTSFVTKLHFREKKSYI